jgi:hypothetical protein
MLSRKIQIKNREAAVPFRFLKPIFGFSLLALTLSACSSTSTPSSDTDSLETFGNTQSEVQTQDDTVSNELISGDTQQTNAAGTLTTDSNGSKVDSLFGTRKAPKIVSRPFEMEGRWINSYYFVRSNDESWESLSSLIYGRSDRANLLMSWNSNIRGPLKVGQVVYYNSALRPDDTEQMKVFSDDFGFSFEQITVQSGDSMSLIGLKMFGDLQTWREIASLNPEITNPDLIEVGQVLKVQQKTFNTKAVFDQLLAQMQNGAATTQSDQVANTAQSEQFADSEQQIAPPNLGEVNPAESLANAETLQEPTTEGKSFDFDLPTKLGISIFLLTLIAFIVKKRMAAKKALSQSWDNQASVMTKISNQ